MNDWERLHRQAERYKQSYPSGTRVMLLIKDANPDETCPTADYVRLLVYRC